MTMSNKGMPNGYINRGEHDHYEPDDKYHANRFGSGPKAFSVKVHVNNDIHEPGKTILVSGKIPSLDHFLDECQKKTNPRFGVPRRIYTPNGRRQVRDIKELSADGIYVITGSEPFRRFNYRDIPERVRPPRKDFKKDRSIEPVRHPWDPRLRNKSGRCQALNEKVRGLRLRVHIIDKNEVPFKVVSIPHKDKDDIIRVTDIIADQLKLRPIMRMYEICDEGGKMENFKELWRRPPEPLHGNNKSEHTNVELERDQHILLLPKGEAKELREPKVYWLDGKPNFKTSPRVGQFGLYETLSGPRTPYKHGGKLNKYSKLPSIGSNTMSPMSNVSGSHPGGRAHNRHKNQRPAQQVNYDRDDGVYRAKNAGHAQDARQVNETKETRTERPIDEMEAEIVTEEDIRHKEKTTPIPPGTELNKQPSLEQKQNADTGIQTKKKEERMNGDAGHQRFDESEEDSFNNTDRNASQSQPKDPPRSSTPASRGEARRKEKQQQDEAAAKIQAGFRGRKVRQEYKKKKQEAQETKARQAEVPSRNDLRDDDEIRRKEKAASVIQASYKGHKVRREVSQKKVRDQERFDRENRAAGKIQSGFRGYKVRKEYATKRGQKKIEEIKDINDNKTKDDSEDIEKREKAAVTIQSNYKGYRQRQKYKATKAERDTKSKLTKVDLDHDKEHAAAKIQAGFKGYQTRKAVAANKKASQATETTQSTVAKTDSSKEDEAASRIQANFKGFRGRKEYAEMKKEKRQKEEDAAASKIQASFKGYQTRKAIAQKKKDAQLPDPAETDKGRK